MKLSNKVYDILKWIVMVFLPALATLIFTLGSIIGFDACVTCGIITAVDTFLGALIGISTIKYNEEEKIDQ